MAVTAGLDGRLTGIRLDPRLRRLHVDEVAAAVMVAANAALEDAAHPRADGMASFTGALTEALNRLGRP